MFNKKVFIIFSISLLITIASLFGVMLAVKQAKEKPVNYVYVAVAKQNIPAGTFLKPNMYQYIKIPENEFIKSYITMKQMVAKDGTIHYEDPLEGLEVRENIYAGEKIMKERLSDFRADNQILKNPNIYKRMTYTAEGIDNMAGQLREGDRVDFWCRYELRDKNGDTYIVVEKILANVPVVRAIDSSYQEIKNKNGAATTIEVLLTEDEVQQFLVYKNLGRITVVKSNDNSSTTANTKFVAKKTVISIDSLLEQVKKQYANNTNQ